MSLLARVRLLALVLTLASLVACTPPSTPTITPRPTTLPTTPPSAIPPSSSLSSPTSPPLPTATTQPAPSETPDLSGLPGGGPVALRDDIQIRRIASLTGSFIRRALDPMSGELYYLDGQAHIYRIRVRPEGESQGRPAYTLGDIGGAATTEGMAFGPDGTLYVVSNNLQKDTNQGIIRQG